MAATLLDAAQITHLLTVLSERLPNTSFVYWPLRDVLKGTLKAKVWADEYPNTKAVVITPEPLKSEEEDETLNLVFACTTEEGADLASICDDERVIKQGTGTIFIQGVQTHVWTRLKGCLLKGPNSIHPSSKLLETETVKFHTSKMDYHGSLPDGFTERKLTADDSEMLARHWSPIPGNVSYLKNCIEITGTNVGVMNEKNELVAWSLRHLFGSIGFTYVLPKYRKLGLGKHVTAAMAKQLIAKDGFCLACVEVDNEISLKLHESLGFKKLEASHFGLVCQSSSKLKGICHWS